MAAQRAYYAAKGKNPSAMQQASMAYSSAQEQFRKFAKYIQTAQAEHEKRVAEASVDKAPKAAKEDEKQEGDAAEGSSNKKRKTSRK